MGEYTADDNRSMQLNDNNERYHSSREDYCDDDDATPYTAPNVYTPRTVAPYWEDSHYRRLVREEGIRVSNQIREDYRNQRGFLEDKVHDAESELKFIKFISMDDDAELWMCRSYLRTDWMEGWPRGSANWSDSVLHEFKSPTIKKYFGVDTWDEFVESFSKPIAESRCGLDGEFVKAAENLKEVLTSLPPNLHHYLRGQHWRKARPVEQIRWLRDIDGNPVFDEEIFWENWKTGTKYDKIIERMRQDLPLVEATLKAAQKDLKDLEKEIEQKINDTYNVDEHLRGK